MTEDVSPALAAWLRMVDGFLQTPVAERNLPPDPDIPTAVVLGTRPEADDELAWWTEEMSRIGQQRTVTYWAGVIGGLSNGTLVVANDAGHYVFRDVPGLALEAVRWVVDAARHERH